MKTKDQIIKDQESIGNIQITAEEYLEFAREGNINIFLKPNEYLYFKPKPEDKKKELKKGISACEEILNSQQTKPCRALATKKPDRTEDGSSYTKDKTADTEQEKAEGVVYPKGDSDTSPVQTLIKQALSQRNQEILKIIDKLKMKHTKKHSGCGDPSECCFNGLDVLSGDFIDELKQQLNQPKTEE